MFCLSAAKASVAPQELPGEEIADGHELGGAPVALGDMQPPEPGSEYARHPGPMHRTAGAEHLAEHRYLLLLTHEAKGLVTRGLVVLDEIRYGGRDVADRGLEALLPHLSVHLAGDRADQAILRAVATDHRLRRHAGPRGDVVESHLSEWSLADEIPRRGEDPPLGLGRSLGTRSHAVGPLLSCRHFHVSDPNMKVRRCATKKAARLRRLFARRERRY